MTHLTPQRWGLLQHSRSDRTLAGQPGGGRRYPRIGGDGKAGKTGLAGEFGLEPLWPTRSGASSADFIRFIRISGPIK
jgi:hypothetical protein